MVAVDRVYAPSRVASTTTTRTGSTPKCVVTWSARCCQCRRSGSCSMASCSILAQPDASKAIATMPIRRIFHTPGKLPPLLWSSQETRQFQKIADSSLNQLGIARGQVLGVAADQADAIAVLVGQDAVAIDLFLVEPVVMEGLLHFGRVHGGDGRGHQIQCSAAGN